MLDPKPVLLNKYFYSAHYFLLSGYFDRSKNARHCMISRAAVPAVPNLTLRGAEANEQGGLAGDGVMCDGRWMLVGQAHVRRVKDSGADSGRGGELPAYRLYQRLVVGQSGRHQSQRRKGAEGVTCARPQRRGLYGRRYGGADRRIGRRQAALCRLQVRGRVRPPITPMTTTLSGHAAEDGVRRAPRGRMARSGAVGL